MSSPQQPLFEIERATTPPSERLAAMHRESERIAEENAAKDRVEVPLIIAKLALQPTVITSEIELGQNDYEPPTAT